MNEHKAFPLFTALSDINEKYISDALDETSAQKQVVSEFRFSWHFSRLLLYYCRNSRYNDSTRESESPSVAFQRKQQHIVTQPSGSRNIMKKQ
ncbi:MAG: hypothetical protein V8T26_09980 [[Eubacterium] siraeum]